MEKRQAQNYIKDVLNRPFDQERFDLFIRNLLNDIEPRNNSYSGNFIPEAFREHITHYKRIAKYTDPEGEQLDILIIQARSVKKLERTRTALRNFVVRHLKTFEKQYALAAFYSKEDDGAEWRFSLVKIDYETKKSDKGKIKVEEELVPAKRFSFLVGKYEDAHTAQKQLLPLLTNDHSNPLIVKEKDGDGSVEGAFSIQKVTDEFYEQYKELYLKLAENQSLANALKKEGLGVERFVKKLLGQIVFLYFIQKKGWLGVPKEKKMGEGSKRFLQDRFELAEQNGKNYYNSFLRYLFYEALAREHNDEGIKYFYKRLNCKIPFLNGGLFEAEFDWEHTDFTIPNNLFRNNEKNKAGDKGTGILDVFDRYNFTIKEDEPLEKEVAVDPEMLGKVFENMLEIKERKSKGAYYTPREIVHYMCQESLIHYLDNAVNDYTESYQSIGSNQPSLVGGSADKKGNLNLEIENKGDIRVPKEDIEIFIRKGHLALEHEATVQSKGKETDSYKFKLPESIRTYAASLDKALADIKICDPAIGSGAFPVGLLHEIVTARQVLNSFLQRDGYTPYNLKRHAIQESIYGVDIDASAIDIARLRLWLSMIVDEEDYDTIEALPNLDYKIVRGNSLIGLPGQGADRYPQLCDELENLKEKFFKETDENKKKELRAEINEKINQVLKAAEDFEGYKIDFDFKLYFSEVWRRQGGFDVVIGNPPYVNIVNLDKEFRIRLRKLYTITKNKVDLYAYFIEKSSSLLRKRGVLIFIVPHTWKATKSFQLLREFILSNLTIDQIVNLDMGVFKATVTPMIIQLSNIYSDNYSFLVKDNAFDIFSKLEVKDVLNDPQKVIDTESPQAYLDIYKKIESEGIKLGEVLQFTRGIKTSNDKRFISNEKIDNESFKVFRGKNIRRYNLKWGGEYIWYKPDKMKEKVGSLPHTKELFQVPEKLITQRVNSSFKLIVAYDKQMNFFLDTTNVSKSSSLDKRFKIKFLLALLNSSPINFWYCYKYRMPTIGLYELHSIPIKYTGNKTQQFFVYLADYMLYLDQSTNGLLYSFFYQLIDALSFELYIPIEIHNANKQILSHLGDLKPITDDMSNEEKLAIIQSEFERLYDPNHPVRNNLETLDSIEEVRVIKEALK